MTTLARTLATLAFLALMLAGLGFVVAHLAGAGGANVAAALTGRNLKNGRFAAVLDKAVVEAMPKTTALDDISSGLAYRLFGDAGAQVRAGCPGWLFLAEELVEYKGGEKNLVARAQLAVRIRDEMARRNIALVVLPVPDKAELAADSLCGLAVSGQARGRRGAWQATSASLGLDQVYVAKDWPKGGSLRTDTHWSGTGASFAASRLAEAITRRLGPGDTRVSLGESAPAPRVGDLMRLAGLSRSWPWSGPAPDEVRAVHAAIARSGGLLDDVPVPSVLLAGSSFSLNSGFADRLQAALGREVAQRSRDGGGFAGALLDILDATPQMLDGVRLVVWEFPLRVLTQPLTETERRYLGERT
ncbi:alginate O-acetyltransferase AlgX-related protein [Xanthobacter oligotrophicus]|uniref:alginate O-acetyltransferase AlgX-related protein n=1 Tax=Xanthobacter oligotrophicus TaxID=2607286 RepID=UPI0011F2217E|nr:cell division protein FtsQ [Xanthobacter oligotrophicus]MCG5237742.1 hypothetical protein [Xanthobacter oligotrophicus]